MYSGEQQGAAGSSGEQQGGAGSSGEQQGAAESSGEQQGVAGSSREQQVFFYIQKPPHSCQGSNSPRGTEVCRVPCPRRVWLSSSWRNSKRAVMKANPNNAIAEHVWSRSQDPVG